MVVLKGEPRLQFNEVRLLQDVMENLSEKNQPSSKGRRSKYRELIELLKQRITEHKGNKPVNITLHDKDFQLTLKSRKEKVAITKELTSLPRRSKNTLSTILIELILNP